MSPSDKVRSRLDARGVSLAEWSRQNGFKPRTVYAVFYGQLKGKRGVSHQIAVALGLKGDPAKGDIA